MDQPRIFGDGNRIASAELFRYHILKTNESIKEAIPAGAEDLHKEWASIAIAATKETRTPVLFAMLQTLRECINEELPPEAQKDVAFQVEDKDGNKKIYKNYKEFYDDHAKQP